MRYPNVIMFVVSGVLIYLSVLLPRLALQRSKISHSLAVILSSVGVGVGAGLSVFWGASNRDFIGSSLTGGIVGLVTGLIFHWWWKDPK